MTTLAPQRAVGALRPGRPRRLVSPRLAESMRVAYEEGASLRAVAALYGVSSETTRRALIEAGVTIRPRVKSKTPHPQTSTRGARRAAVIALALRHGSAT